MDMLTSIMLLVIMVVCAVIFLSSSKKKEEKLTTSVKTDNSNKAAKTSKSSTSSSDVPKDDVFKFMEFDKILDGMIVQDKGSKFTMAIKCKGINYDLMSDIEQLAVEEGFITFLNTLRFPIQLYVQAQNIDLKGAISKYKENIEHIKTEFQKSDYQYTKIVEAFDSTQEQIDMAEKDRNEILNVYEYASDIINYVERMSYNKSLLQRNFYVLVSYHTAEVSAMDKFSKDELINICYNELLTRCQNVIGGLASSSVEGKVLDSNELADLLYTAYNRDDKGLLGVKDAIDSGFYRLYSTSEDAFLKKKRTLAKEIDNEAKIKAMVAIRDSINKGTYVSPHEEVLEYQEDISKKASDMVNRAADIPEDIKKMANDRIREDYRNIKKELLEQAEIDREEKLAEVNQVIKESGYIEKEQEENSNEQINREMPQENYQVSSSLENNRFVPRDNVENTSYQNKIEQNSSYVEEYSSPNYSMDFENERINPTDVVRTRMEEEYNNGQTGSAGDDLFINQESSDSSYSESDDSEIII